MKSEKILTRSMAMLDSIGMIDSPFPRQPKLSEEKIREFEDRKLGFGWVHLATTDLPIHRLFETIDEYEELLPPRSGHIGNWGDIAKGRSGTIDYNKAICQERGLGYPLVYAFNQTEDDDMKQGDSIYLPGSIVHGEQRIKLDLFAWDENEFVQKDRNQSYFTPYALANYHGELQSLIAIHRNNMRQFHGWKFKLEADVIWNNRGLFREIIRHLLNTARLRQNSQRSLQDIISHVVTLDGRSERADISALESGGYLINGYNFHDVETLLDAVMAPFLAAVEPDSFFSNIREMPKVSLVVSNNVVGLISAIFNTHYPEGNIDRKQMNQPVNPHFHWGAIGMAGYPPYKMGYFSEKSSIKTAKWICKALVDDFRQIDPVYFILLPAAIFTTCPTDQHNSDLELVEHVMRQIVTQTDPQAETDILANKIYSLVEEWWRARGGYLSNYYTNRFSNRRSVLNSIELPQYSNTVEPPSFRQLTLRQASMLVGSLTSVMQRDT